VLRFWRLHICLDPECEASIYCLWMQSEQSSYFPFKSTTLSPALIFFPKHLIGLFLISLHWSFSMSHPLVFLYFWNSEFIILSSTVLYTLMREQLNSWDRVLKNMANLTKTLEHQMKNFLTWTRLVKISCKWNRHLCPYQGILMY
jgi:hypothetical protein